MMSLRLSPTRLTRQKERQKVLQYARQFLDGPALKIFSAAGDPANPGKFNDDFLVNCVDDPALKTTLLRSSSAATSILRSFMC